LLNEEGRQGRTPLLVEEGWRQAPGWWGAKRGKTTRPRQRRVLPSSTRRADREGFRSSSRRGGAKRRGGGVRSAARPPVRDSVAPCPPRRGGQAGKHSPPRGGGVARSAGVVGFRARQDHPSATASRPALLDEE